MPFYENVFIARQDISATQVEALADALTTVVTEQGGQITKREYWGLRNLSYRIKKNRKGHYVLFNLDAPPGGERARAHHAHQRGRAALPHGAGRGARGRPVGGDAEPRPRRERDRDRDRGGRRGGYGDRDRDEAPRVTEGVEE